MTQAQIDDVTFCCVLTNDGLQTLATLRSSCAEIGLKGKAFSAAFKRFKEKDLIDRCRVNNGATHWRLNPFKVSGL